MLSEIQWALKAGTKQGHQALIQVMPVAIAAKKFNVDKIT